MPPRKQQAIDPDFVSPMLASPLPATGLPPGDWSAEEKFDGHRLILSVDTDQMFIRAWSRNGIIRPLSQALLESARLLPPGIYDGELIFPGGTSSDVVKLENLDSLRLVLFDILELNEDSTAYLSQDDRRRLLEDVTRRSHSEYIDSVHVVPHVTAKEVERLAGEVWDRGGEGLILKNALTSYQPSKRSKEWLKIKRLQSAVLSVLGFTPGELGPFSILRLIDDEGHETAVKWKNHEWLLAAAMAANAVPAGPHPWLGRQARIDFQSRTADGSYRHPRFDRWEDERTGVDHRDFDAAKGGRR